MAAHSAAGEEFWEQDPMFSNVMGNPSFDELMGESSPYPVHFDNFTDANAYTHTHDGGISVRNLSNSGPTVAGAQQQQQPVAGMESSSPESASDGASRRKRKVTESPESTGSTEFTVRPDESMRMVQAPNIPQYEQYMPTQPMRDLKLEQGHGLDPSYRFKGANASPSHPHAQPFHIAMPSSQQSYMPATTMPGQFQQTPPQTVDPSMFQMPSDPSPVTHLAGNAMYNSASPNPLQSTPSSDGEFNGAQPWTNGMSANPSWPNTVDYSNQFNSPNDSNFTPSPRVNGAAPALQASISPHGLSPLHIASVGTKSRVETQINVVMTLEKPPPGIEQVHLPLHTIAKSKLLAKDQYEPNKTLELCTMLVCTSAMNNPQNKARAMHRAAMQSNSEIQRRAEMQRDANDEDKNDPKNVDDADKPANGGEVKICHNCIQRERKRAARKKLKKEEEQQHWERFETERVVVFNSNEFLPLKAVDVPEKAGNTDDGKYKAPKGSLEATAAMRIACYCRHQQEKDGFQVIFTLKDQQGSVVAQQISNSILITDDHKTHPTSMTMGPNDMFFAGAYAPNGLPTSHSMVDLQMQGAPHFTSSRSTGNLQALQYGQQQYNPHSHVHQLPNSGYASQATSATMTPTSLSRPASPTGTGYSAPNKKRKSSSFHKRVPSSLTMTRVDTNQPPSSNLPSAQPLTSPFSPIGEGFGQPGYMAMPNHNGAMQFMGSGPPTPSEGHQPLFSQEALANAVARSQNSQAYFSHPSSAVPSRSSSPVLQQQSRPNMAAYARLPIQTPTNTMQQRQAPYQQHYQQMHQQQLHQQPQQQMPTVSNEPEQMLLPTITKITPTEGPVQGGTDVSIYGYNFVNGMTVKFGDTVAAATFYGSQALLATAPPSRPGGVNVTLVPPSPAGQHLGNQYVQPSGGRQIFTYKDHDPRADPRVLEMAMRMASQQQYGSQQHWLPLANQMATQLQTINGMGQQGQGQGGMRDQGGYQ